MNELQFKKYASTKTSTEFNPAKVKEFKQAARRQIQDRITELSLLTDDLKVDIQCSQHSGYKVRHLQNRLRDAEENLKWNQMLIERMGQ